MDILSPPSEQPSLVLSEGRFARFAAIGWWDQSVLNNARVLVVGAGALGNEVLKNLSLIGVGNIVIVDKDRVETSNLSRSILFRKGDEGQPKAACAAHAAQSLYSDGCVQPIIGNVLADVGLGYFRWANVIIGALDNREARVFVNSACAKVRRPWIDGGIDVLMGTVRGFAPPSTACYECTMSKVDWDQLNRSRSCSLLARRALKYGGTPTTPTTASVIGALQVQEMVKFLHGMDALMGQGLVFDGAHHASYTVSYPISPECTWHEPPCHIEPLPDVKSDISLQKLCELAERRLGGLDAIDFAREIVIELECPSCGRRQSVLQPPDRIDESDILCSFCGSERSPHFIHSIARENDLLSRTVREIGLPHWDIVWARRKDQCIGLEIAGDCPFEEDASRRPSHEGDGAM